MLLLSYVKSPSNVKVLRYNELLLRLLMDRVQGRRLDQVDLAQGLLPVNAVQVRELTLQRPE